MLDVMIVIAEQYVLTVGWDILTRVEATVNDLCYHYSCWVRPCLEHYLFYMLH